MLDKSYEEPTDYLVYDGIEADVRAIHNALHQQTTYPALQQGGEVVHIGMGNHFELHYLVSPHMGQMATAFAVGFMTCQKTHRTTERLSF